MSQHQTSLPRIPAPSLDEFARDWLLPQRPTVLTGLFDGQPLARFRDRPQVEAELGNMLIAVGEEYTRNLLAHDFEPVHNVPRVLSIRNYLQHADRDPTTRLLCSEVHAPAELRALYQVPEYVEFQGLPDDARSMVFVGNQGNFAHLHFDGDYRHVLLYQVFGRKRVIVAPPDSGNKLMPIGNFGQFAFENLGQAETEDFLRFVGGSQCVIEPGEAVFIPAAWWHFIEYVDTAMSVNVRFGRNRYTQFLGDRCHPNCYLQCIASRMTDASEIEKGPLLEYFHSIERLRHQPAESPEHKGIEMEEEFRRICLELNPDYNRQAQIELPSPVKAGFRSLLSRAFYPQAPVAAGMAAGGMRVHA